MSYLVVRYCRDLGPKEVGRLVSKEQELIEVTSKILNKAPEEIIIDFEPYETYRGARKAVIRGETSLNKMDLLDNWAEAIREVMEGVGFLVGIKTYSVDSKWKEVK
jgi:hypothetical protein